MGKHELDGAKNSGGQTPEIDRLLKNEVVPQSSSSSSLLESSTKKLDIDRPMSRLDNRTKKLDTTTLLSKIPAANSSTHNCAHHQCPWRRQAATCRTGYSWEDVMSYSQSPYRTNHRSKHIPKPIYKGSPSPPPSPPIDKDAGEEMKRSRDVKSDSQWGWKRKEEGEMRAAKYLASCTK